MTIEQLHTFFGLCTLINFSLLIVSTISLLLFKEGISVIHSSLFGLSEKRLPSFYFKWLAGFKIFAIIFSLVPYLALSLMV